MKVVLFALNGSYSHTNLAIRCLRSRLEDAGFDIVLIENSLRDRDNHILKRLYDEKADIYAFSTYIWNVRQMLEVAQKLKSLSPGAVTVFGGPEVSFETERYMDGRHEYMDFIICGEGEISLPLLCCAIRDQGVEGARRDLGRIICGEIAQDAMTDEGIHYRASDKNSSLFYYESSRGCPYSCAYCLSSTSAGVRAKSVDRTLADLREFENFADECKVVKFVDRTFNFDIDRANRIWQALLSSEFTRTYHFEICVSLLNEESYRILSNFPNGKIQLEIGLQSTNFRTLDAVSRHILPESVIFSTNKLRKMGNIPVYLDLIAGLPYDDIDSFSRSFDQAYFCATRLQVGFLKLLPGTVLRRDAEMYGYKYDPNPPYTVLENAWMTYSDLERIHMVHELLERYADSEHFTKTLEYVLPRVPSPFAFWASLADFIGNKDGRVLQKISQLDAYRLLGNYLRDNAGNCYDLDTAIEDLRCDFQRSENKKAPWGI